MRSGYKLQQPSSTVTWRQVSCARRKLSDGSGDEIGFSNNDRTDGVNLPAAVTWNQFSQYMAIDCGVQTAADITDKELCSTLASSEWLKMLRCQAMQTAVKWPRRQTTMPVIPPTHHAGCCPAVWTLCGLTWRKLAASRMSVHAAGLATLKSMLRSLHISMLLFHP